MRCFVLPEDREDVETVLADLAVGRTGGFHAFKWRLAMALQPDPQRGVVLADVWESRSHEMAQQIAVGLYPTVQVSGETLDKTDAWLTSAEPNAALRRLVSESRAGVERALRAQAADAAAS